MTPKNILLVSASFYPEISPRSYRVTELAKEFSNQGHKVTVITKEIDARFVAGHQAITFKKLGGYYLPAIKISGGKYFSLLKRAVSRILLMFFEYPDIGLLFKVNKALKYEQGYDLMISIAVPYPIHWGVARSRRKNHRIAKVWVADCGDPFMGNKSDSFRKLFYFKYIEKWFCRKTDYISIPIESAKNAYYPEFREKMVVIPQGFDFGNRKPSPASDGLNHVSFAFAGSMVPYVDTAPSFLKHLISCGKDFKFILFTNRLGWAEQYIDQLGGKVEVRSYVQRDQLLSELAKVDFLINFMYRTNEMLPSKLIDYGLTGRPILNIGLGEDYIAKFEQFMSGNYEQKFEIHNIEQYNIKNVVKQFIELVHD
jgi:hypothetical protein